MYAALFGLPSHNHAAGALICSDQGYTRVSALQVSERNWGQEALNPKLKQDQFNPDKKVLGTQVGLVDAMRFAGAIPETANSR